MAGRTVNEREVRDLVSSMTPGKPLPLIYFVDASETPAWRATAFLVRCRAGGFMVAVPDDERVTEQLQDLADLAVQDHPLLYAEATMEVETPRRKAVGPLQLYLVDVPWVALGYFRKATSGRGALELIPLTAASGAVVRPLPEAARSASDAWINETGDDGIPDGDLAEYITAESHGGSTPQSGGGVLDGAEDALAEVARLRARLADLEKQAAGAASKAAAAPPRSELPRRGARELFPPEGEAPSGGLAEADWKKLRAAAGQPPGRLAGGPTELLASTTCSSPRGRQGLWTRKPWQPTLGRRPTRSTSCLLFRLSCLPGWLRGRPRIRSVLPWVREAAEPKTKAA